MDGLGDQDLVVCHWEPPHEFGDVGIATARSWCVEGCSVRMCGVRSAQVVPGVLTEDPGTRWLVDVWLLGALLVVLFADVFFGYALFL